MNQPQRSSPSSEFTCTSLDAVLSRGVVGNAATAGIPVQVQLQVHPQQLHLFFHHRHTEQQQLDQRLDGTVNKSSHQAPEHHDDNDNDDEEDDDDNDGDD